MRILLSPAKKMRSDPEPALPWQELPEFLPQTEQILSWLRSRTAGQLKALWKCNDAIAELNLQRLADMDLRRGLTPAVLAYEGIAYQYMAPAVFESRQFDYIREHLRILSGFYGVLRPMDGVVPYRLEMQAKADISGKSDLYHYWGDSLYRAVRDDSGIFIDLASKEYSQCISKYLTPGDRYYSIVFCEAAGGRLVTKGTYAKMARGEMVRYMAENAVEKPEELRSFDRLGYIFREDLSTEFSMIFERRPAPDAKEDRQ